MMQSISTARTMIWIIASIFYAYQYVLRVMPNILLTDIMEQFCIDAAAFGQFSGVYYIGYALLHLPVGILLDRYGPRKIMSFSILLTSLGCAPLLFSTHWIYPVIGRFFLGVGSSSAILGVFKVIRLAFHETQFPRMLSLSVTIGLLGAIYGGGPVHSMRSNFGYEAVLYFFVALGLLLALVTYWIVPETQNGAQRSIVSDLKEVLSNTKVLWISICAGLMVGPLEGFADVWGSAFLKSACGCEGTLAASLPSLIFIGMCFGSPILSFIADKIGNYLLTIVGAGVLMTAAFIVLLVYSLPSSLLGLEFIMIGVCCAYQILAIYKASTYAREQTAGLTTAVTNMIIMTFGYVFHTLMGSLIHAQGGASSPEALFYGIIVIPAALCLGSVGFMVLFFQERRQTLRSIP